MNKSLLVLALALCGQALAAMDDSWHTKLSALHALHKVSGAPAVSGAPGAGVTPPAIPVGCLSAAQIAASDSDFSTLVAAADRAGLVPMLSSPALKATIFAPTNAAFASLLKALRVTPAQLLVDADLLRSVLLYHVLPQPMTFEELASQSGNKLDTLLPVNASASASHFSHMPMEQNFHTVTPRVLDVYSHLEGKSQALLIVPEAASPAKVVKADVNAGCPTIVQVIDSVLVPAADKSAPKLFH
eukprot:scaffold8.g1739.t1